MRGRRWPGKREGFDRACTDRSRDLEGRECVNEQLSSAESFAGTYNDFADECRSETSRRGFEGRRER